MTARLMIMPSISRVEKPIVTLGQVTALFVHMIEPVSGDYFEARFSFQGDAVESRLRNLRFRHTWGGDIFGSFPCILYKAGEGE